MNNNIVKFPGSTKLDLEPNQVLAAAADELDVAIVVGLAKDGGFYFASSSADGADVLYWLERARHKLMMMVDALESGES
jgi:hypothetical protein